MGNAIQAPDVHEHVLPVFRHFQYWSLEDVVDIMRQFERQQTGFGFSAEAELFMTLLSRSCNGNTNAVSRYQRLKEQESSSYLYTNASAAHASPPLTAAANASVRASLSSDSTKSSSSDASSTSRPRPNSILSKRPLSMITPTPALAPTSSKEVSLTTASSTAAASSAKLTSSSVSSSSSSLVSAAVPVPSSSSYGLHPPLSVPAPGAIWRAWGGRKGSLSANINMQEFVCGLVLLVRASTSAKITALFRMFDTSLRGVLTRDSTSSLIRCVLVAIARILGMPIPSVSDCMELEASTLFQPLEVHIRQLTLSREVLLEHLVARAPLLLLVLHCLARPAPAPQASIAPKWTQDPTLSASLASSTSGAGSSSHSTSISSFSHRRPPFASSSMPGGAGANVGVSGQLNASALAARVSGFSGSGGSLSTSGAQARQPLARAGAISLHPTSNTSASSTFASSSTSTSSTSTSSSSLSQSLQISEFASSSARNQNASANKEQVHRFKFHPKFTNKDVRNLSSLFDSLDVHGIGYVSLEQLRKPKGAHLDSFLLRDVTAVFSHPDILHRIRLRPTGSVGITGFADPAAARPVLSETDIAHMFGLRREDAEGLFSGTSGGPGGGAGGGGSSSGSTSSASMSSSSTLSSSSSSSADFGYGAGMGFGSSGLSFGLGTTSNSTIAMLGSSIAPARGIGAALAGRQHMLSSKAGNSSSFSFYSPPSASSSSALQSSSLQSPRGVSTLSSSKAAGGGGGGGGGSGKADDGSQTGNTFITFAHLLDVLYFDATPDQRRMLHSWVPQQVTRDVVRKLQRMFDRLDTGFTGHVRLAECVEMMKLNRELKPFSEHLERARSRTGARETMITCKELLKHVLSGVPKSQWKRAYSWLRPTRLLTPTQVADLTATFNVFDKDSVGTIPLSVLVKSLYDDSRENGLEFSNEEMNELVKDIALDEHGRLNLMEFLLFYRDVSEPFINFSLDCYRPPLIDVDLLINGKAPGTSLFSSGSTTGAGSGGSGVSSDSSVVASSAVDGSSEDAPPSPSSSSASSSASSSLSLSLSTISAANSSSMSSSTSSPSSTSSSSGASGDGRKSFFL